VNQWIISVPAYVFRDGAHRHFTRGEARSFALEYYPPGGLQISDNTRISARHNDDAACLSTYQINAEIVYLEQGLSIIDCGIQAYRDYFSAESVEPPMARLGASLTGSLRLCIDSFPYKEYYRDRPAIPPLIYTWHIDDITMQWAPLVDGRMDGEMVWIADDSRTQRQAVETTRDAVPAALRYDRNQLGRGARLMPPYGLTYYLHCTRLPEAPQHHVDKQQIPA
jgi:hypothetical protein